jgi:hypothetical protein
MCKTSLLDVDTVRGTDDVRHPKRTGGGLGFIVSFL